MVPYFFIFGAEAHSQPQIRSHVVVALVSADIDELREVERDSHVRVPVGVQDRVAPVPDTSRGGEDAGVTKGGQRGGRTLDGEAVRFVGAGGGGFFLLYVPLDNQADVKQELSHLLHVPFRFESRGSQIIFYDRHREYREEELVHADKTRLPVVEVKDLK